MGIGSSTGSPCGRCRPQGSTLPVGRRNFASWNWFLVNRPGARFASHFVRPPSVQRLRRLGRFYLCVGDIIQPLAESRHSELVSQPARIGSLPPVALALAVRLRLIRLRPCGRTFGIPVAKPRHAIWWSHGGVLVVRDWFPVPAHKVRAYVRVGVCENEPNYSSAMMASAMSVVVAALLWSRSARRS